MPVDIDVEVEVDVGLEVGVGSGGGPQMSQKGRGIPAKLHCSTRQADAVGVDVLEEVAIKWLDESAANICR